MENCFVIIPHEGKIIKEEQFNEIEALLKTADAVVLGHENYKILKVVPSTYIGKGKLEEIKNYCAEIDIETVVFDGELTPSQTLNMAEALDGLKVIDRTTLILDIFALSARSAEGKIQVELAQLKYMYPRLKGKGEGLSRLGGGIGTRGPGESKLETDRRHIRRRINYLEKQLNELTLRRALQSDRRKKNNALTVALVGYTNTGKSTLLNALTESNVLSENKLFATLDPTLRKMNLGEYEIILADTVGFIKNIPTTLIEAFKSTLETAVNADLNLIVCDALGDWETQLKTALNMLDELNADAPRLIVFNKCESLKDFSIYPQNSIFISALNRQGFDLLVFKIKEIFASRFFKKEFDLSYKELSAFLSVKDFAEFYELNYFDDYVKVKILAKKENELKFKKFYTKIKND